MGLSSSNSYDVSTQKQDKLVVTASVLVNFGMDKTVSHRVANIMTPTFLRKRQGHLFVWPPGLEWTISAGAMALSSSVYSVLKLFRLYLFGKQKKDRNVWTEHIGIKSERKKSMPRIMPWLVLCFLFHLLFLSPRKNLFPKSRDFITSTVEEGQKIL